MKKQRTYEKFILALELIGFAGVLAVIWLDEFIDLPFLDFGAAKTPPRPEEYWFETICVLLLGVAVVSATLWVFRRLRILEDLIRVCAWCRKVNVGEEWVSFEDYMKLQHDVKSTHGICPTCRADPATRGRPALADISA